MATAQSADLFGKLYGGRMTNILGGAPSDPYIQARKREGAYDKALSDYTSLIGGEGTTVSPTTVRSLTRPTLPKPVMPTSSYSVRMSTPVDYVSTAAGRAAGTDKYYNSDGTQRTVPLGTESTAPAPPTPYNLPVYDTSKVEGLAQRFATPGIRNLRHSMQDVQQGAYDNPNVKRMTLRDALAGYGQGLESVMAGALKEGTNVYGQQYGAEVSKAGAEFGAGEARVLQGTSIASQERMQGRGITSQELMQGKSLASQEAMHASSLASNETLTKYNNEFRAYLASLG